MSSIKPRIRLACAIAALGTVALLASCRGFFVGNTYTAITIQPTPQVPLGGTQSFQLWGTNTNSSGTSQITSGANWTIGTGTTGSATISNPSVGTVTGAGVGSITVNAEYQGLTTSASGVVYLTNITSICVSTTNTTGSCSASNEGISSSNPTPVSLYAIAAYKNAQNQTEIIDITTSATWTITGPSTTDLTCVTSASPAVCTLTSGAPTGNYIITVSYPQSSITATNTIIVGT